MGIVAASAQPKRFGRYEVVQHLDSGGMADVLLARTTGIEGFERYVVIKRIRAEQARDAHYVAMFLDEARLAASLHHANVVQVNDIGCEDGEYFFAMEYVLGEDARRLLQRAAETDARIPLEHVLSIVIAAAAGLHHAHEQIRPDGVSLGIVHRDVSPANILIGFDGGIKVVDFGIAKAAHQSPETQSNVLKGKVAYMSPEQCNSGDVDRRSDVFSLGIVLWELCTVRPLFIRENDFLTMSAIVNQPVPSPSTIRPDLPRALERIIMRALAPDPADRFQTADEMRRALEALAIQLGVRTSTTALADYMRSTFGERRAPWLVRAASADEEAALLLDDEGSDDDEPEIEVGGGIVERTAVPRADTAAIDTAPIAAALPPPPRTGAIPVAVPVAISTRLASEPVALPPPPAIGPRPTWENEDAAVIAIDIADSSAVGAVETPGTGRPRTPLPDLVAKLPATWRRRLPAIAGGALAMIVLALIIGRGATRAESPSLAPPLAPSPSAPMTARTAEPSPSPAPAIAAPAIPTPAIAAPAKPVAPARAKTTKRPPPKKSVKPHWNPNALFPD